MAIKLRVYRNKFDCGLLLNSTFYFIEWTRVKSLGTTWVSEIISLICHGGDIDVVKRVPLHDRVHWLELDNNNFWVRFFWFWTVSFFEIQ